MKLVTALAALLLMTAVPGSALNGGPGQDRCEYGSSDKAKSCEKRVKVSGEPT